MPSASELAADYIDLWNERSEAGRKARLTTGWTGDATYIDPIANAAGSDALSQLIGGVQQQFPDFVFCLKGTPDGHSNFVRFSWGLGPAGQDPIIEGTDFVVCDGDKIASVTGFLDRVPAGA